MRATQTILATLREDPGDTLAMSHRLLLRSGLTHKLGAGLYHLLPLGLRTFRKIEGIVRQEMDAAGALEFQPPILTPAELWKRSGRWESMGKELFRLQDRHAVWNVLGPTHEESFTELLSRMLKSYKDLPKNVYQIHTKFRDEIRPRFGMIRAREFCMKDAYSFHLDEGCLENTYNVMRRTYRRIFERMGLQTITVEADTGAMGGLGSEEFMVATEIGEEILLVSEQGTYRSNREKTPVIYPQKNTDKAAARPAPSKDLKQLTRLHTPGQKSIAQVARLLKTTPDQILKAVLYVLENKPLIVFLRADREVNEIKLKDHLSVSDVSPANNQEAERFGLVAGFMGPLNLSLDFKPLLLWDHSVKTRSSWIIGANESDYHCQGCVLDPDIQTQDLALARAGDPAPNKDGCLQEIRGIEVGHIFKLGRKYSQALKMKVLDKNGKELNPWMGCYGIGINRAMATIVEQCHDSKGICWPVSVAPYEIVLVSITTSREEENAAAELYQSLLHTGCEVLWDDRVLRPGVKFKDAELIGFPIRITMGKHYFGSGELEVQLRSSGENFKLRGNPDALSRRVAALKDKSYAEIEKAVQRS